MSCFVCTANDFTRGFDDYFLNSLSFSSLLGLLFFRFYTFLVDFFFASLLYLIFPVTSEHVCVFRILLLIIGDCWF